MPNVPYGRKQIYVSAEDLPAWDIAQKWADRRGLSLAAYVVRALRTQNSIEAGNRQLTDRHVSQSPDVIARRRGAK